MERDYNGKSKFEQMKLDKKTLHNRNHRFNKTGIIKKERKILELSPYQYMLDLQKGVCAICEKKCTSGRALAIDHDHETLFVRGLLCGKCNRGLGLFCDSSDLLLKASKYLKKNGK